MSLCPGEFSRMFYGHHPMGRLMRRTMAEDPFSRSLVPYWLDQPLMQECNIGNAVGKVIDDKDKFGVAVNVTQFRPDELSVTLKDKQVVIEGRHEERSDHFGCIQRHFIRKYTVPDDVNLESLESHLSDEGILCVCAKKKTASNSGTRTIPINVAPSGKALKHCGNSECCTGKKCQ